MRARKLGHKLGINVFKTWDRYRRSPDGPLTSTECSFVLERCP